MSTSMQINPHNLLRQPFSWLWRCFYYVFVHVTCKLTCYKWARPYARRGSTMHIYPLRQRPTCANTMSCRTVSTNEMICQLSKPLGSALTNPCSCLMHTFPDYCRSALVITSNENACLTLQNQVIQVNTIHTCIKTCSELTLCIHFGTWWEVQRGRDSAGSALLPQ